MLDAYRLHPEGETQTVLRTKAEISGAKFTTANASLLAQGWVEKFQSVKAKQPVYMYRLTEAGQAGQAGQKPMLSDSSGGAGQLPPPLGGSVRPAYPLGTVDPDSHDDLSDLPSLADFPADMVDGDFR